MSNQDNQSYLAKLTPWGGRSSPAPRPAPVANPGSDAESASGDLGLKQTKGSDHRVSHRHRLSSRSYPKDCPPLLPQWFFATDVPKRRPSPLEQSSTEPEKPRLAPRKYAPFSKTDSKAIEAAFQRLACEEDAAERDDGNSPKHTEGKTNSSLKADENRLEPGAITVPVNEDYLFDVDVERRELAPAYWLGPVYEVRRGTWFYQGKERLHSTWRRPLPICVLENDLLHMCFGLGNFNFIADSAQTAAVYSGRAMRILLPSSRRAI